jgi:hypothetical protein
MRFLFGAREGNRMKRYRIYLSVAAMMLPALAFAQKSKPASGNVANVASACDAVSGNLVKNCGFEASPDFANWTTVRAVPACSDLFVDKGVTPHTGNNDANFAGACVGVYDAIKQTIATVPGVQHTLSFWLQADPGTTSRDLQVLWNGVKIYDNSTAASFPYFQVTLTVVGTGNDVLTFQGYNVLAFDDLDDVVLTPNLNQYLSASWWYWYVL